MNPTHLFIMSWLILVFTACSSAPIPQRKPIEQRLSVRQLNKGTRFYHKGCLSKAVRHFMAAHERFAASDDLLGSAESLSSLANTYYRLNDLDSAIALYDEANALYAQLEHTTGQVRVLTGKSVALATSGKVKEAEYAMKRADRLAERDDLLPGIRYKAKAILRLQNNDVEMSQQLISKAIRALPSNNIRQQASAQYTMGYLLLTAQQPQKAKKHLTKALKADRTAGDYLGIGQDLEALGDCHSLLEEFVEATAKYNRSIKIYALLNNSRMVQQVSFKLVDSAAKSGTDIQTTLHWAAKWLAGQREANICR